MACDGHTTGFGKQGDILDDDRFRVGHGDRLPLSGGGLTDGGVNNCVEALAGLGIIEHDLSERRAVKTVVRISDGGTEGACDLRESGCSRCDHLPGEDIGVDKLRAVADEELGDGGFAGPDPTGEGDVEHQE